MHATTKEKQGESKMSSDSKNQVSLTEGPIWKQIILFTIPLLLGNIFQQMYNAADSIIVGNFLGSSALAAVGSSSSVINLLVSAFMGISVGAGVVISKYYGGKDEEGVERAVHTMVTFGIIGSIVLTVLGIVLSPYILVWMGTPDSVMQNSVLYFRIFFAGIASTVMYNIGSGIFRAVGDSKRPLYYLIISTIINVILDLIFIAIFHWGIAGAAIATVIAQTVSCILTFYNLISETSVYQLKLQKLKIYRFELKQIIRIGLPGGLQNSIVSLSNVIVQSNINSFGELAIAGCGAYWKIDGFALLPASSFALAVTTFVSQNIGARKFDRVKKGTTFSLFAGMITAEVIGVIIFIFAPYLIALFNRDPEVIAYGSEMARNVVPAYFLVALSHGVAGVLRGAGKSVVPMITMICFWCILRVIYMTVALRFVNDIHIVYWAYPITWTCSAIVLLIYLKKVKWMPAV